MPLGGYCTQDRHDDCSERRCSCACHLVPTDLLYVTRMFARHIVSTAPVEARIVKHEHEAFVRFAITDEDGVEHRVRIFPDDRVVERWEKSALHRTVVVE